MRIVGGMELLCKFVQRFPTTVIASQEMIASYQLTGQESTNRSEKIERSVQKNSNRKIAMKGAGNYRAGTNGTCNTALQQVLTFEKMDSTVTVQLDL